MQAYLTMKFDFTDEDLERIKDAQYTLRDLRDALSKTGIENETKDKLNAAIYILSDIVLGKEIT